MGIYFDPTVSNFDRITFIRFITEHLDSKSLGITEHIHLYCPKCHREISNEDAIQSRIREGNIDIVCQYDNTSVFIPQSVEELYQSNPVLRQTQDKLQQEAKDRTGIEIEKFRVDQREYSQEANQMIHILHLSDIHLLAGSDPDQYRIKLEADLKRELEIHKLEYLVISGDFTHYSKPEEYAVAFQFLDELVKRFGLDAERVILVPGNHDINWDLSEDAYPFVPKNKLPQPLPEGQYIPAGEYGGLLRNDESYKRRFENFSSHFYNKAYGIFGYPLEYTNQYLIKTYDKDRILFLALNSAWEIDHHTPH